MNVLLKDAALRKSAPLFQVLLDLAQRYALTTDTLSQLDLIYSTAQRRLNGIRLNQDIWGHSGAWVPRMSLAYYGDRVTTIISNLEELEDDFKEYAQRHQRERITGDHIEQALLANRAIQRGAKTLLDSIAKAAGDLDQAVDAVELCRPRLVATRNTLNSALRACRTPLSRN
ncbi:hypothetical protein SBRCBS47491_003376 [Sporothrix bragantina]|uniref:Uncharacterized protein n=1 Tax=Sporothrix bragantina TaxID=671064 RepID=A0ABP0BFP1_9PEZI